MSKGDIFFWIFFAAFSALALLTVTASISVTGQRLAYIDTCRTMGGTPIIGTYETYACLKAETVQ